MSIRKMHKKFAEKTDPFVQNDGAPGCGKNKIKYNNIIIVLKNIKSIKNINTGGCGSQGGAQPPIIGGFNKRFLIPV